MKRRITYASQLASSTFALQDQNEQMFDLSTLISGILGDTTQLSGLACTPTFVPSLSVNIAPGAIFIQEVIDATDYGTPPSFIPADSRLIQKFAYTLDPSTSTFVPPLTVGFSRNDLIQFSFEEVDDTSTGLSFFGGTTGVTVLTPTGTTVIQVANNSITNTVNVERSDNLIINVKQGVAAATGTQVTPTPDAGYVGGWVVTTTQGVSTITSGDIALYPGAPFILEKLKDKASISGIQSGQYIFCSTSGTNTYTASLNPAITAYQNGMQLFVNFVSNNTGASTLNINGIGARPIVTLNNTALTGGELGDSLQLYYNSGINSFVLSNVTLRNFNYSLLTSPGYRILPDLTIEQWGNISVSGNNVANPITFPIPFTTAVFNIVCSFSSPPTISTSCAAESVSVTTFNLYQNDPSASHSVYWRAIGY